MRRTVYLNGEYLAPEQARVSIFDRGILFGDAVYEVAGVLDGKLVDFDHHYARLKRSLGELGIPEPLSRDQILSAYRQLVVQNALDEGLVYLQITRGEEERDFVYGSNLKPTVFMFSQIKSSIENDAAKTGVTLKSVTDIRWARRDIKSVNLLGQVLAKKEAADAGAYEALMIDQDGNITEGGATSFFIVKAAQVFTRPLSNEILPGITRGALLKLVEASDIKLVQQRFQIEDVYQADEAFITGASSYVLPVVSVDGNNIGSGKPGPITARLRDIYIDHARANLI